MGVNQGGGPPWLQACAPGLTGAVAVDGVLPKHVELPVFGDDAAAAVVAGRVHRRLALQLDHLLRLVGLWLSAALGWTEGTRTHTHTHTHLSTPSIFATTDTVATTM